MATEVKAEDSGRKIWRPHLAKEKDYEAFSELFRHHIDSFDHMVEYGLEKMMMSIKPVEVFDSFTKLKLRIWFDNPEIYPPQKERTSRTMADALYPFECRQAKLTYAGQFLVNMNFQYDDGVIVRDKVNLGQLPIMLKSKLCHLKAAKDPKKKIAHKEEPSEMGGYFILNGLERVIRLLILPKRNYPMRTMRNSFRERHEGYTDKAVVIRCVPEDLSAVTVKLYYLNNESARLGFLIQGREYLLPVGIILKIELVAIEHAIWAQNNYAVTKLFPVTKRIYTYRVWAKKALWCNIISQTESAAGQVLKSWHDWGIKKENIVMMNFRQRIMLMC